MATLPSGPTLTPHPNQTYTTELLQLKRQGCELQCWTEGRSSMAVAEDLGPTATATVAEV